MERGRAHPTVPTPPAAPAVVRVGGAARAIDVARTTAGGNPIDVVIDDAIAVGAYGSWPNALRAQAGREPCSIAGCA
jgi:hypothetical protein